MRKCAQTARVNAGSLFLCVVGVNGSLKRALCVGFVCRRGRARVCN